jgi:phosphofructokinase-like protein
MIQSGSMSTKRIAVNTGGGDAPGLNAVIRAIVLSALRRGWEVYGIRSSYGGLLEGAGPQGIIPLDEERVRGITYLGGTILGTTNKGDPYAYPTTLPDGKRTTVDRSEEVIRNFKRLGFDALIAIGGDGSLRIAYQLFKRGIPTVAVPKTIDNDLAMTDVTFGFDTAVSIASDALGRLHSTAESHERVIVVELMGRYAGWIALYAGLAASVDAILIPELPYDVTKVCEKIMDRERKGRRFSIVVVAEGAMPRGGAIATKEGGEHGRNEPLLGGIAERLAREIGERTGKDTRSLVLGHLQRGGGPTAYDRVVALRFGVAAVRAVDEEKFGCMVALRPPSIELVALSEVIQHQKHVPLDGDIVETARALGVCLGD